MARFVMTARRRAALKKAQLASARKRRKAGIKGEKNRRRAIERTGRYKKAGGFYHIASDYRTSSGVYSRTRTGKKIKKKRKVYRKINGSAMYGSYVVGLSSLNGRRKGTNKKKSRKAKRP